MNIPAFRASYLKWIASVVALVAVISWSVLTNSQPLRLEDEKFIEGGHYELIEKPVKLASDDKIEVMEVFWYGCGHCMTFEGMISGWKKNLADDVVFMRTPAVLSLIHI